MRVVKIEGGGNRLVTRIEGHPTESIGKAHEVCDAVLHSNGAWHFTHLEFTSPMQQGYGNNQDSRWMLHAIAETKYPR